MRHLAEHLALSTSVNWDWKDKTLLSLFCWVSAHLLICNLSTVYIETIQNWSKRTSLWAKHNRRMCLWSIFPGNIWCFWKLNGFNMTSSSLIYQHHSHFEQLSSCEASVFSDDALCSKQFKGRYRREANGLRIKKICFWKYILPKVSYHFSLQN